MEGLFRACALFIRPIGLLSAILMKTAVNAQLARVDGGAECQQVAYIHGETHLIRIISPNMPFPNKPAPQYILDKI